MGGSFEGVDTIDEEYEAVLSSCTFSGEEAPRDADVDALIVEEDKLMFEFEAGYDVEREEVECVIKVVDGPCERF